MARQNELYRRYLSKSGAADEFGERETNAVSITLTQENNGFLLWTEVYENGHSSAGCENLQPVWIGLRENAIDEVARRTAAYLEGGYK